MLFAANPLFLLWAIRLIGRALHRRFTVRDGILLLGFGAGLCALCLHGTMGGWQFGARYTVDLFPFVLADQWQEEPRPLPTAAWTLLVCAILFNLYGAVYMLG